MGHLPKLIEDLALILVTAAITTLLFRKIRQPLVLGYILAGLFVSPYISITPSVADPHNVETLAEIGVIFLLFSLGLEFSFKKLLRVGGSATITAMVEIVFIVVAGYFVGQAMGWSKMDSIFLGGMLASSSTTIIIRAFDELGVKTQQFARVVFGVLVVEDIVVILLMVLLSTMAVSNQFEGTELIMTVSKLLFFLVLWFVAGIFLLPTFLRYARKLIDEETLLILSIGLCLGMVVIATQVGFSAELGAFIMGSILAETTAAEKVEHVIKPVRDLFGAVFFVSVGMLIDPDAIWAYKWPVLWVTLLTLFGKFFSTTLGALLSGQPLRQSVQVGMSMAQIGEFAFIVATLGLSLNVISNFLFPVAVGASAITTFTTPYLIKSSNKFYIWLEKTLPSGWLRRLKNYSSSTQNIQAESTWKTVLKAYLKIILTNGVIILGLILLSVNFLLPFVVQNVENEIFASALVLVVSLGVGAPFVWALMAQQPGNQAYKELWLDRKYSHGPLLVIEVVRNLIGILFVGFWVNRLFSTTVALVVVVPVVILVLLVFSSRIQRLYQRLEKRFVSNLNARENAESAVDAINAGVVRTNKDIESARFPWDVHIVDLEVVPEAAFVGKTLMELGWREEYGINIAYIKRGDKLIHTPGRNNRLLPFDKVGIIGTDAQLQQFTPIFDEKDAPDEALDFRDIQLQKIVVDEFTRLKGSTIRNSNIRELTNGLVIGIERGNERILNPDSNTVFQWGDIVWIVGERDKILSLKSDNERIGDAQSR